MEGLRRLSWSGRGLWLWRLEPLGLGWPRWRLRLTSDPSLSELILLEDGQPLERRQHDGVDVSADELVQDVSPLGRGQDDVQAVARGHADAGHWCGSGLESSG